MWNIDGYWRPIVNELAEEPTAQDKITYIQKYFDEILYKKIGNYAEVKDELADHYISNLEKNIEEDLRNDFIRAFKIQNANFGGATRIRKVALDYEKNLDRSMRRQFYEWFKPRIIWLVIPLVISLYLVISYYTKHLALILIGLSILSIVLLGFESHKNKQRQNSLKTRNSKVIKYLGTSYSMLSFISIFIYCAILNLLPSILEEQMVWYVFSIILIISIYSCSIIYYYHKTVCFIKIEPFIEKLKLEITASN